MMKISIVTAVYNRENTIGQTMQSVQAQDYKNVEHILQDGRSSDATLKIIESATGPNTHLRSEADMGIYDAINRGITRSTGDVVGLLHSDDYFAHNEVLTRVAFVMANDSNIDGVYGDLEYIASTDTSRVIRKWRAGEFTRAKLRRGWMPPHPTLYLRRSVFERFGTYDTSYRISADYDTILRLLWTEQIRLAYIPEVLVKMRVGGESNGSFRRITLKTKEDYRALRRNNVGGLTALLNKNLSKIGQFLITK